MKPQIKRALRPATRFLRKIVKPKAKVLSIDRFQQQIQRSVVNQYKLFKLQSRAPYKNIQEAGFRAYSQFEEDGIILYVLSMIGFKTRRVVEMCCGSGDECMATNLILNHGFDGYLFDGDAENVRRARAFFKAQQDCHLYGPTIIKSWITAENVNQLMVQAECVGEVDLFSLDIDGNDYWVLRALEAINPRLLILETHNVIPSDKSLTIPYRPDFSAHSSTHEDFRGVSLLAMVKLCEKRGYRLIGAHRHGFNAFFLRNDEGIEFFPEVSIQQVHDNHWTRINQRNRWPPVAEMPWQIVS
jgi:hypothetical protein